MGDFGSGFKKKPSKRAASRQRFHFGQWSRFSPVQKAALLAVAITLIAGIYILGRAAFAGSNGQGSFRPLGGSQSSQNPLQGKDLYVDPNSNAARQADIWRNSEPAQATLMDKLADQPNSHWFSGKITYDDVHNYVNAANDANKLPVLVAYFIPNRDCNKYSSGGAQNADEYYDYIDTFAQGIGDQDAVVVLEPDALVHMESDDADGRPCLDAAQRDMYATLLKYAVDRFKSLQSTTVYIDAGNSAWQTGPDEMAGLLKKTGIDEADGFSLNVSNFRTTDETMKYGDAISKKVGGKHYVIDTSRNGLGPYVNEAEKSYNWCNPPDRALGHYPTVSTGEPQVDAFLYIKNIGESDGSDPDPNKCFGGPKAGTWWPEYAAGLVERWPAELQYNAKR
jgi:endoglucanase